MHSEERWVEVKDYPGYLVSNHGRVVNQTTGRILRQTPVIGGRVVVAMRRGQNQKKLRVDRLVYNAFGDTPLGSGDEIYHVDRDKRNNAIWNLISAHRGRAPNVSVRNTDTGEIFSSISAAARSLNVPDGHVAYAIRTANRKVAGFHFELVDGDNP